jgi:hypothetical protein
MSDFSLKAIISVVDRASRPLAKISRALGGVGGAAGNFRDKMAGAVGPLGFITAGASAAGLYELVKGFSETGSAVHDLSTKIGISAEKLQEFQYKAKLDGVEAESLSNGMVKLNKAIAGAALGQNKDAAAMFQKLGIKTRDAAGHVRSAADVMPELANAMQKNENAALRTIIAQTAFGKSGADLIPMLVDGAEGMRKAAEEARHLGIVLSDEAAAQADELGDSFDRLHMTTMGLRNAIGAQLAPTLTPLVNGLAEWIAANRELISSRVTAVVQDLAVGLRAFDWAGLGRGIMSVFSAINKMSSAAGGAGNMFYIMAGIYIAPTVVAVLSLAKSVGVLGYTMATAKFGGVSLFGAIAKLIPVVWSFSAALLANPLAWVVAGIAALAGSVYLLYANWSSVASWWSDIWTGIRETLAGVSEFMAGVFTLDFQRAFDGLTRIVGSWVKTFQALFAPVAKAISWAGEAMGFAGPDVPPIPESAIAPSPRADGGVPSSASPAQSYLYAQQGQAAAAGADQTAPERSRVLTASRQRVEGEIVVRFDGVPAGTRVENNTPASAPVSVSTNVGYRRLAVAGG